MQPKFRTEFTNKAFAHLESFRKFERNIILDGIKAHLPDTPMKETRNKKQLRGSPLFDWELRIQKYRVFYEVHTEEKLVRIVAVGYKEHNKLYIGGEEITL